jgi:hypothetical protein
MSDIRRLLEAMDSMSRAETKPTGPKFPGYWQGTDPASAAKNKMVGGAEESVIPELAKTAKKKSTEWELEEAFKQFKEGEFRRDVVPQQRAPVDTALPPGYGKPLDKLPDPQGDQSGGFKKVQPGEPFDTQTNSIKVNPATGNVDSSLSTNKPKLAGPEDTFIKDKNGEWIENPKYSKPNTDISPEEMDDITRQQQQQQKKLPTFLPDKNVEPEPSPQTNVDASDSNTSTTKFNPLSNASKSQQRQGQSTVNIGTTANKGGEVVAPATSTDQLPVTQSAKPGSWQEIARRNNITDPTKLRAGQVLDLGDGLVLPKNTKYIVQPNDTLSGIANRIKNTGDPRLTEPKTDGQQPEIKRSRPTMQADRDQTPPSNGTAKSVTTTPVYPGGEAKRKAATTTTPEINYSRDPDVMSDPTAPETKGYQRSPEQKAADAAALAAAEKSERARQKLRPDLPKSRNKPRPQISVPESFSQRLAKDFEQFLESDEPYAGYDRDVEKLKQRAKLGPMKTVWDEKTQRYRVVPVKPQEKQIKEYGNAQDPNQQTTDAAQQQTSQTGNQQALDQQVDIATAKSTMSGLKNVLGPQLNTNAAASGVVKMNDGKPLSVPEREAISTLTPLVTKAAENPATAGALKSALSTAGVLAKQGK